MWSTAKAVLRRKKKSFSNDERPKVNELSFHFKIKESTQQDKPNKIRKA